MSTAIDTFNALTPITVEQLQQAIPGKWDCGDIDYLAQSIAHTSGHEAFITIGSDSDKVIATLVGPNTGALGDDNILATKYDLTQYLNRLRQQGYIV